MRITHRIKRKFNSGPLVNLWGKVTKRKVSNAENSLWKTMTALGGKIANWKAVAQACRRLGSPDHFMRKLTRTGEVFFNLNLRKAGLPPCNWKKAHLKQMNEQEIRTWGQPQHLQWEQLLHPGRSFRLRNVSNDYSGLLFFFLISCKLNLKGYQEESAV